MGEPPVARRRIDQRLARRGGALELLRAPAAVFGALARARGALYDRALLPVLRVDAPVVSVGNLTAGGTGKTPMTAWLVRRCAARGLRAGILSRGYGRARRGGAPNDEARMLAEELPDVLHVQDPDRVRGAQELVRAGVDVIVLDDGFQHRRLHRDLDVVLVDATRPWGLPGAGGARPVCALLPRGLLRERPAALARADAVVLTRCDGVESEALAALEARVAQLAPGVPRARARHVPVALVDGAGRERALAELAGLEVDLVSGLGNPEAFEATVRALGARVAAHRARPDHHAWQAADLAGLGARPVLTSAKDRAKLVDAGCPAWTLRVELAFDAGQDALDALLDALPPAARAVERRALHEGLHG